MRSIVCMVFLMISEGLWAQVTNDTTNFSGISIDVGIDQVKEENIHPKAHTGTIEGITFVRYFQNRNIAFMSAGATYSRVKTAYEDLSATVNAQLFMKYNYLFKVFEDTKIRSFIGPNGNVIYNVSYYPNWDDSHLYWADQLIFGIDNLTSYKISGSKSLVVELGFNVVSLVSRPKKDRQYKIDDLSFGGIISNLHSNAEFGSINKSFNLLCKAEYQVRLTAKYAQSLFYQYNYVRLNSRVADLFQNSVHKVGLTFYFL